MTHDRFGPPLFALALAIGLGTGGALAQTQLDGAEPAVEPATDMGVPTTDIPADPATPEQNAQEGSPATIPVEVDREPSAVTEATEEGGGDAGTAQALADDTAEGDVDADEANQQEADAATAEDGAVQPGEPASNLSCQDELAALENEFGTLREQTQAALAELADVAPLVLRMSDGSVVDMRAEDDIKTGPVENWFGDPPVRDTVRGGLDSARGAFDSGDETACLDSIASVRAAIEEWQPASAATDAAVEAEATEDVTEAAASEQPTQPTDAPAAGDTAANGSDTSAAETNADTQAAAPSSGGSATDTGGSENTVQFESVPVEPQTTQ